MKFYSYVLENDHLKEIEESMDDYSKEREEFMKKFFPKKNEDDFTIPFVNSRGEYGYPLRSRFYKKRFKELSKKYELKKNKNYKAFLKMLTHEKTLGFKIRYFFKFKFFNYLKVFKKYFFYEKRKRQLTNN